MGSVIVVVIGPNQPRRGGAKPGAGVRLAEAAIAQGKPNEEQPVLGRPDLRAA